MQYLISTLVFLSILQSVNATEKTLVKVPLFFIEALAPKDSTSSERFTKDYQGAIDLGKRLTKDQLEKCGYELETTSFFYDANDPIQAREQAEKAVKQGAWLLVGPRRSNHYLLLVKGAEETPTLSIMASASEVRDLGPLHTTMSPLNSEMAEIAAKILAKKFPNSKYISITSEDCITCKDFSAAFSKKASTLGISETKAVSITGELPAAEAIVADVKSLKPRFILLPNYSKTSSYLIAAIHKVDPKIYFVGGDGWGDSKFGFIQAGQDIGTAEGLTVRGFPPAEEGLKSFKLGKLALKDANRPTSGPSMAILKAIEGTALILCKSKPKSSEKFKEAFIASSAEKYAAPWGVSLYGLKNGEIAFKETKRLRR